MRHENVTHNNYVEVTLICFCGESVTLKLIGGQYQNEYDGTCHKCGRKWLAIDISSSDEELE